MAGLEAVRLLEFEIVEFRTATVSRLETANPEARNRNAKNKDKRTLRTFEVMVVHLLMIKLCTEKGNPKGVEHLQQK